MTSPPPAFSAPRCAASVLLVAAWAVAPSTARAEFQCATADNELSEDALVRAPEETQGFPCLKADLYFEAQGNQPLTDDAERNAYAYGQSTFSLILSEHFAAQVGIAVGAADDDARNRPVALVGDYGLRVNTARVRYSHAGLELHAGSYSPEPALISEFTPGMYTSSFADDYYLETGTGAGAAWTSSRLVPFQTVQFTADAFLTDQLVAGEDVEDWFVRPRGSDTVLGYDYASVLATASGQYRGDLLNIRSRGAVMYQSGNSIFLPDQVSASMGLAVDMPLDNGWILKAAAEAAAFEATGPVNHWRAYLATGAAAAIGSWQFSLGYAVRERHVKSARQSAQQDWLAQASIAYYFPDDLAVELGYRHIEEYGNARHEVGVRITWEAVFMYPN